MRGSLFEGLLTSNEPRLKPPYSLSCFGEKVATLGSGQECWEVTGSLREHYYSKIHPKLCERLFAIFGTSSLPDWITLPVYMVGRHRTDALPTIMVCSEDEATRKRAKKEIKKSDFLGQHAKFKVMSVSEDPGMNNLEQLACDEAGGKFSNGPVRGTQVLFDSSRPVNPHGMQIWVDHGSSLRPATAFATWIDGRICLRTVSHAFLKTNPPMKPVDYNRKVPIHVDPDSDSDSDSETGEEDEDLLDSSITSIGSQSPDTISDTSSNSDSSLALIWSSGKSTPRINEFGGEAEKIVPLYLQEVSSRLIPLETSPSTYSPKEVSQPPEHALERLGKLAVWSINKDWALIKISNAKILSVLEESVPGLIMGSRLIPTLQDDAEVIAYTSSGGRVNGTLSGTPFCVRIPNSTSFQEVYRVRLNNGLANGDCGSAVRDAITGELHGHVIAGCKATGTAYIMASHQIDADCSNLTIKDLFDLTFTVNDDEINTKQIASNDENHRHVLIALGQKAAPSIYFKIFYPFTISVLLCLDIGAIAYDIRDVVYNPHQFNFHSANGIIIYGIFRDLSSEFKKGTDRILAVLKLALMVAFAISGVFLDRGLTLEHASSEFVAHSWKPGLRPSPDWNIAPDSQVFKGPTSFASDFLQWFFLTIAIFTITHRAWPLIKEQRMFLIEAGFPSSGSPKLILVLAAHWILLLLSILLILWSLTDTKIYVDADLMKDDVLSPGFLTVITVVLILNALAWKEAALELLFLYRSGAFPLSPTVVRLCTRANICATVNATIIMYSLFETKSIWIDSLIFSYACWYIFALNPPHLGFTNSVISSLMPSVSIFLPWVLKLLQPSCCSNDCTSSDLFPVFSRCTLLEIAKETVVFASIILPKYNLSLAPYQLLFRVSHRCFALSTFLQNLRTPSLMANCYKEESVVSTNIITVYFRAIILWTLIGIQGLLLLMADALRILRNLLRLLEHPSSREQSPKSLNPSTPSSTFQIFHNLAQSDARKRDREQKLRFSRNLAYYDKQRRYWSQRLEQSPQSRSDWAVYENMSRYWERKYHTERMRAAIYCQESRQNTCKDERAC